MVAEAVPEKRRIEAGALLYTSAPLGLALATLVNYQVSGVWFRDSPEVAWRYVFMSGLLPAAVALIVRFFVKEPERWANLKDRTPPRVAELFSPANRKLTISGLITAVTALITWWTCNAFIPVIASGLAGVQAAADGLTGTAVTALKESWKAQATNWFNLGGLIGTLLTVPAAKILGRRAMFAIYFLVSGASLIAFGFACGPSAPDVLPHGAQCVGVFGSFTYYLPELFPTRLRGTGSGFCYNIGRVAAAVGPFLVVSIVRSGSTALESAMHVLFFVGFVPIIGTFALKWVIETKGRALPE